MPVIPPDRYYPEYIREHLEKFAAQYPERDFWHITAYPNPDTWSSRPCGDRTADIIRNSPEAMQAALEEKRDG
jgi:hypothetical protein